MKITRLLVVLALAVIALGYWAIRTKNLDAQKNAEISTLDKKVAVLTHEVAVVHPPSQRTAEIVTVPAVVNASQPITAQPAPDPREALAAAEAMPPGPDQDNALMAALTALAAVDPQTALADSVELTGGNRGRERISIFEAWSAHAPADAAAALEQNAGIFASTTTLNNVTATIAKNWLNQDPSSAVKWINTLPSGGPRDNAVTQIVSTISQSDPASALTWSLSIDDAATRNNNVVKLMRQWSNQNPAAAAAALQKAQNNLTGLTDAQATALQNILAKSPGP